MSFFLCFRLLKDRCPKMQNNNNNRPSMTSGGEDKKKAGDGRGGGGCGRMTGGGASGKDMYEMMMTDAAGNKIAACENARQQMEQINSMIE